MNERELFVAALNIDDSSQRLAFLEHACADDHDLRRRVEALLEAFGQAGSYLEHPAAGAAAVQGASDRESDASDYSNQPTLASAPGVPPNDPSEDPAESQWKHDKTQETSFWSTAGTVIADRYTLQEKIGEGGMGEVWIAKQSKPVRRKVAIKLIKVGMDSRSVLTRFEQERQALAMMDHPNIAKVLDGGMTSTGQPYFVMELVNGLAVHKFCDQARLTPRERLELFVPICQAIQHAHQKGIVHRDLKPANILVTVIDGKPVPKVIDFGVAKAIGGKLTEETLWTQFGAVVGTLEYMSPEQAGYSGMDIDTRSDIYSLGVVLYELLTGVRPIDAMQLKHAAMTEMIRMIVEDEPSKPSTRLSTEESLPTVAALRKMEPKKLMALLRGELDWVIMKCLEKHRDRRYETANALARDIQRFLAGEIVEARAPTIRYRISKFVQRRRGPVVTAILLILSLVGGLIGTTIGMFEANEQRVLADMARKAEEERAIREAIAKEEAEGERKKAEQRLAQIEKSNELLGSIFRNLDPEAIASQEVPLQTLLINELQQAAKEIETGVEIGDPAVVAMLQGMLGESLTHLGEFQSGIALLSKALAYLQSQQPQQKEKVALCLVLSSEAYALDGQFEPAVARAKEAVELCEAEFGKNDGRTISSINALGHAYQCAQKYEEALPFFEEAVDRARIAFGAESRLTLTFMNNLATCLERPEHYARRMAIWQECVRIAREKYPDDHRLNLVASMSLARAYLDNEQGKMALTTAEAIMQVAEKVYGPEHYITDRCRLLLADAYSATNQFTRVIEILEPLVPKFETKYGEADDRCYSAKSSLAVAYWQVGKLDLSVPLFEELRQLALKLYGPDHNKTTLATMNLGINYIDQGRIDEALPLLEETHRKIADFPQLIDGTPYLANIYRLQGDGSRALQLEKDGVRLATQFYGAEHPRTLDMIESLGTSYFNDAQYAKSVPLFESLVETRCRVMGTTHPKTFASQQNLAANLMSSGSRQKAREILAKLIELEETHLGVDAPETLTALAIMSSLTAQMGDVDQTVLYARKLLKSKGGRSLKEIQDFPNLVAYLADQLCSNGHVDLALEILEEAASDLRDNPDSKPFDYFVILTLLGKTQQLAGQEDLAIEYFEELAKVLSEAGANDSRESLINSFSLFLACRDLGNQEQALAYAQRLIEIVKKGPEKVDLPFAQIAASMASFHLEANVADRNLELFEVALQHERATQGSQGDATVAALLGFAERIRGSGRTETATTLTKQLHEIMQRKLGADHPLVKKLEEESD